MRHLHQNPLDPNNRQAICGARLTNKDSLVAVEDFLAGKVTEAVCNDCRVTLVSPNIITT